MRRFLGILLIVLGLPVLIAGGAAAVYVGPDDTIDVLDEQVSADSAVVATDTSAITLTGPTLYVSADTGTGETFVGAAHPVHVDSYLDGVALTEITDATWRGDFSTTTAGGDLDAPETAPAQLDWWRASSAGAGEQQLGVELTDEPFRLVIAGADLEPLTGVDVRVGAEIDGLFIVTVVAAALGILLVVGGILLLRRRKPASAPRDDHHDTEPGDVDEETDITEPTPLRPSSTRRPGTVQRTAVIVGIGAFALAGCAELPGEADHEAHTTVAAVTPEAAAAFFEHYTEVNNEANAEQDAELIASVETGPLLTSSQMGYEVQQAQDGDPIEPFTVEPSLIAAPEFDSYPMWFFAASEPEGDAGGSYHLVTREDAASPWKAALSTYPPAEADVPLPETDDGVATIADDSTAEQGMEVLDALVTYAEDGEEPDGIDLADAGGVNGLPDHGLEIVEGPEDPVTVEQNCSLRNDDVRWLATDGGALALATIACTQDVSLEDDFSLTLESDGYGTLPGDTPLTAMTLTHGVTFLVAVNDDGSAAVYGESMLPYEMDHTEE
ncbi:hypothetical protein EF847_05470 [Actinobacteria bacterium YIM 96077]|uniref:DUF8094 domain-containing protein n=1 Tax=Phytoactinopolyspora halophila TaxID=1981511 RepID=A0A329R3D4_9ACTN|nr:hypothetical protein [Phytoactinopolyspora halophila]AYY12238.1 hypothetical protein EF847_05470 [Actinobacteria bacterium YIM 96077]RAW18529.1 hypothetical protein DPM12_00045 [Phytoactinopolyspora halophila]